MDEISINFLDIRLLRDIILRFILDLIPLIIIVRYFYYSRYTRKKYLFAFTIFNILIFFICVYLKSAQLGMGFAFGLFAVFGMLRYRTETIDTREMTYLFIVIALALINAMAGQEISIIELVFTNLVIIFAVYFLEHRILKETALLKIHNYTHLGNLRMNKHAELIRDLEEQSGVKIKNFRIKEIDYQNHTASINVVYYLI